VKTGFVILNYNSWQMTSALAQKAASYKNIDAVVVVDNGSTDDSYKSLQRMEHPKIYVVQSGKNGGYSYGNNYGAKVCEKMGMEILFFSNPDVRVEEIQIQKILENIKLDEKHYIQLYNAMAVYTASLSRSMVTVTGVTSDVDWLNDTYESEVQTYGVVVESNGREYLILTDRDTIKQAENILVTFSDGTQAEAVIKQADRQTGLAIISVEIADVLEETRGKVEKATLGSSNMRNPVGIPVVALGCPMGVVGSAGYGMITASGSVLNKVDANYKLLTTDIYGSPESEGVLFNMQGQIVGIITSDRISPDMKNAVTAIGISELRKLIENMSNGKEPAYMGISGMDVTPEANQEMGVPFGAYVREVDMNSPAMLGGIQRGDVIVEIDDSSIENFNNYAATLLRLEAGATITVTVQRLSQNSYREMEMEITLGTVD